MNTEKNIRLSSGRTFLMLWVALFVSIMMGPVMLWLTMSESFHIGKLLGILSYLFALYVLYTFFQTACTAHIIGERLVLQKLGKATQSYTFDQVTTLESFSMSRSRYTRLKVMESDGTTTNYLIANNTWLPGDEPERLIKEKQATLQ